LQGVISGRQLRSRDDEALAFASIARVAPLLAQGQLSPEALTELALTRIQELDDDINAFICVMADSARAKARAASREIKAGRWRGALHGIPIAVKDLFHTSDAATTFGSRDLQAAPPGEDATAVRRLREAGAIIIGKTNLDPFAFGSTTDNPHFGSTRNPWRLDCHAGGSSGGSAAAVAAGLAFAALGTDTGVSIRQPAACCGIVGVKPTFGLVSTANAMRLSATFDHVGPMTRTVGDAALLLNALAGQDTSDPTSLHLEPVDFVTALAAPVEGLIAGVPRRFFFDDCHPDILAAVEAAIAALATLGVRIRETDLRHASEANQLASIIASVEAAASHAADLAARPEIFRVDLREWLQQGAKYSAQDFARAQQARGRLIEDCGRTLAGIDLLVMPTAPVAAAPILVDRSADEARRWRNTGPFITLDMPAISVPCGFTADGLPIGLQIVGKRLRETDILRVAHAYESAAGWTSRHPHLAVLGERSKQAEQGSWRSAEHG
jgi:aspartyl-tRNA(Asn)/glutamyl-tRNA(Gln) amidotransferase subunit A